ncbi:MAG: RNA polymerase sigma factor [Gammaproteobacteria bacterium]
MIQEEADEALVVRCRDGDGGGFAALVGRYQRPVFNLAYRMLGNAEDARDVAQAAFLKALEGLHRFDPRYRFFSWLYRIAMNEALDVLGRRGRHTELTDTHMADDDPARDTQTADLGARVRGALGELTPDHRAVLVLRHYQELSYEEIGRVLEIPDATVKSRLFEARERLRLRLTDAAGEN